VHRHHRHYHDYRRPYEGATIGFKIKEPGFKFVVIAKEYK
jgi:hypothetical protein